MDILQPDQSLSESSNSYADLRKHPNSTKNVSKFVKNSTTVNINLNKLGWESEIWVIKRGKL